MFRILFIFFLSSLMSGCVSQSAVNDLTPQNTAIAQMSSRFRNAIQIDGVSGAERIDAMIANISNDDLEQALQRSLDQTAGLAGSGVAPKFILTATINEVTQPNIGLDLQVTVNANYRLIEVSTGDVLVDQPFISSYVAKFSEAYLGATRARLAVEGAFRANIGEFLSYLQLIE